MTAGWAPAIARRIAALFGLETAGASQADTPQPGTSVHHHHQSHR